MSYFDEMIKSERIPGARETWSAYRERVTDFIMDSCPSSGDKVMAIWGAGEANDIDLARLSDRYRLVLIDRDESAAKYAAKSYGLDASQAIVSDIPFWRIDDESYRMFDAMLADGAETEHVVQFLQEIAADNSGADIKQGRYDRYGAMFDYSVAIGLHSQLNSRFAALIYHYRRNYDDGELEQLLAAVSALGESATERLGDYMYHMTGGRLLYGFELAACETEKEAQEVAASFANGDRDVIKSIDYIEGVSQLMRDLSMHVGFDVEVASVKYDVWPFDAASGRKNYAMGFVALDKLD